MNRRLISFTLLASGFILAVFACIVLLTLLVRQPLLYTQGSNQTEIAGSSNLSRTIQNGRTAVIEDGIIRSFKGNKLLVRATGLIVRLRLTSDKREKIGIRVQNVNAESVGMAADGLPIRREPPNTVSFDLDLEPGQTRSVTLYPADNPYDFSFFVFGDSRGGLNVLSRIIDDMNKKKPLFGLDNGDLVTNGSLSEYRDFMDVITKAKEPVLTTIGNHDSRMNGLSYYESLLGTPYCSFSFGECHFIFLRTTEKGLDETQYRWLESDLKTNHLPKVFIFAHVPPLDPRPGKNHAFTNTGQRDLFLDLMKRYRVTRVYLSHIHGYHRFERDGVTYVISGGAGAVLESADSYYHYIDVRVNSEGITEKVVKVPASQVVKTVVEPIKQYGSEDIRAFWVSVGMLSIGGCLIAAGLILFFIDIRSEVRARETA
jgi:hypothetical protein